MNDPHYRKILEGLAGPLDGQKFEECVIDLLRDAYPTLVPIHGGQDSGMDGAIADGEGEAYPLVVTTAKDVLGNLTGSLDSYLAGGATRRRFVVATSTALSPRRRRNLEERARQKGFVLLQVHERRGIANRLYRNSQWAQALLGISGDPPALSAIPRRPPLRDDLDLVGRDADLHWLRETAGDRVVVGQPGSGKTSLLSQLAREGRALFLASRDEGRIASACLDLEPRIVVVDDAHLDLEVLEVLRQIRTTTGQDFALVATTWSGAEDEVADALGVVGGEHVRRLELLTRQEILEVLRSLGIEEPDDDPYLRALVDQSANKPGLAVTLGSLWLRGEWREVLTGRAIRRTLIPTLKRVLEHDPTQLLACFAVGGDRGMVLEVVSRALGEGLGETRWKATRASHGGVLSVRGDGALAVEPEVLRSALLQKVFFTPPALPYRPLLDRAPSRADAVETLTRAALRQVPVPEAELQELVAEAGSREAWRNFAALGERQGEWVLEHYPGDVTAVARAVLDSAPRAAIRRLLDEATGAEGALHSHPSHPLRILQDWVQDIPEGPAAVAKSLSRRRHAIGEAKAYLAAGGDPTVGRRALFLTLNPRLARTRETATRGGLMMRQGILPASTVPEMLKLWYEAREEIRDLDSETWAEARETLQYWIHPHILGGDLSGEKRIQMWSFARRVLLDLAPHAVGHPGLEAALGRLARDVDLELELEVDPAFEALFPGNQVPWGARGEAVRELAERWKEKLPMELARDLGSCGKEARLWGHRLPGQMLLFCGALAERVASPEEHLKVFLARGDDPLLVNAFLRRTVDERRTGWEKLLERSLDEQVYAWTAIDLVLRLAEPSDRLLNLALERAEPQWVEDATQTGAVPVRTLERLLAHSKREIALAAAIGEWLADPLGHIREQVRPAWRRVVRESWSEESEQPASDGHRYWLNEILGGDPALAFDWLQAQLAGPDEERPLVSAHGLFPMAIGSLDDKRRIALLESLPGKGLEGRLFAYLIDASPTRYKRLLDRSDLRRYHLDPLAGKVPDGTWIEMAGLALEAGHDPKRIAEVAFDFEGTISGFGVEHWKKWEEAFETWARDAEGRLREVARHGLTIAQERMEAARAEKRQFELTGRFR